MYWKRKISISIKNFNFNFTETIITLSYSPLYYNVRQNYKNNNKIFILMCNFLIFSHDFLAILSDRFLFINIISKVNCDIFTIWQLLTWKFHFGWGFYDFLRQSWEHPSIGTRRGHGTSVTSGSTWLRLEQHPVRGTWCWVPAPNESRLWGHISFDAWSTSTRYNGTPQERHPFTVCPERRSDVTRRLPLQANMPRFSPPSFLICILSVRSNEGTSLENRRRGAATYWHYTVHYRMTDVRIIPELGL